MVDDVVILDEGRLVTHGPIEFVTAHMGRRVLVRTPNADAFHQVLVDAQATVTRSDDSILLVSDIDIEDVGRMAAANQVTLYELKEEGMSLEETFLSLTAKENPA